MTNNLNGVFSVQYYVLVPMQSTPIFITYLFRFSRTGEYFTTNSKGFYVI